MKIRIRIVKTVSQIELTITKVHEQRIAENPLKNVVGHVNKDPVQNSEHNGSIYDRETKKVEKKKKRDIIKEEKIREKKAEEEEKIVQKQYKAIDKSIKKYTKDVKSKWKKEEKRRKQMKKMEIKAQKMLEKEMKTIEKESVKDENQKQVQAIDVVQERRNGFNGFTVETKERTEKIEDKNQNDLKKSETRKETEITQENKISCDVIEKNKRKENDKKDAKDTEMITDNAGKKNTLAASFVAFFRSLSCIKGQRKSQTV